LQGLVEHAIAGFVWLPLIFVGPWRGTYFMSLFLAPRILMWLLDFWGNLCTSAEM